MNDGSGRHEDEEQSSRGGDPPHPVSDRDARHERLGLGFLALLVVSFSALGAYAIVHDDGPLEVLSFCIVMPTLFGFLVLLGMHMTWLD